MASGDSFNIYSVGATSKNLLEGVLQFKGSSSGLITIASKAAAGTWTLTLPDNDGSSGQVLKTDGSGITSWIDIPASSLIVGSTTIGSGTNGRVLYDNSGVLGEPTTSGSGSVALTTSPTFVTPLLGTPTSGNLANCTFPTLNQDTTGSAAKWTTARNLAGNSVDGSANVAFANKFIVQGTTDAGLSSAQFLGALGTGIVKNTTTTGILSIAVAGDFPTLNQSTSGNAATATALLNARTIGGVSFDGTGNITVASATAGFTVSGGALALGTQSITMTGSLAATAARVTKGWFTDLESTNMPTVGGTVLLTSLTAPQFTTIELGNASDTTLARVSGGQISVEGVQVDTISNAVALTNKTITDTTNVLGGVTMTLGSDATGDTYYRNSSGILTRVAAGAQKTVLKMGASSVPAWGSTIIPLYFGSGSLSPADATTYFFGSGTGVAPQIVSAISKIPMPIAGTITRVDLVIANIGGVQGSNETSNMVIRLNNTTDTTVISSFTADGASNTATLWAGTGLSITVAVGDYIEFKWLTPTWATNPTLLRFNGFVTVTY